MFSLVSAKTGNGVEQAMIDLTKKINIFVTEEEKEEQKLDQENLKKKNIGGRFLLYVN